MSAVDAVRRSHTSATGAAWKFPPDTSVPVSAKTIGLSVAAFISISITRRACAAASRAVPCTCGMQRSA